MKLNLTLSSSYSGPQLSLPPRVPKPQVQNTDTAANINAFASFWTSTAPTSTPTASVPSSAPATEKTTISSFCFMGDGDGGGDDGSDVSSVGGLSSSSDGSFRREDMFDGLLVKRGGSVRKEDFEKRERGEASSSDGSVRREDFEKRSDSIRKEDKLNNSDGSVQKEDLEKVSNHLNYFL